MSQPRGSSVALAGRKIRFRNLQAPNGFTPPELPVDSAPAAADDSALWGESSSYNGTPDAPSGPEANATFTLPSGGRRGKSTGSKTLKSKTHSGKNFSKSVTAAADSPTKPPKVVRVAKPNPVTGAVEWEDVEVRYGKPKVKPFAINCTFGLPRVLNKDPPLNSHQQAAQQNYNAQHHLPPISVTPDPSMRSSQQPKMQASPSVTVVSGMTGHVSPAGTVLARRQEYARQLLANGTASSDQRPSFVSITERKAEARRINDGSFEAFVRPRSSFPASEQARKNVPPFASVARARRRHNTGDSSSDSDNEIDQDDLSERLQKLTQRRARLLRDMRRSDGGRCGAAGGRANQPDGWGSVNMRRSTIVADAANEGAADQTPPESTVDVSLSMIDYEIQWTRERLRRIREAEHELEQQKQEQQLVQSQQQRTSSPPNHNHGMR